MVCVFSSTQRNINGSRLAESIGNLISDNVTLKKRLGTNSFISLPFSFDLIDFPEFYLGKPTLVELSSN